MILHQRVVCINRAHVWFNRLFHCAMFCWMRSCVKKGAMLRAEFRDSSLGCWRQSETFLILGESNFLHDRNGEVWLRGSCGWIPAVAFRLTLPAIRFCLINLLAVLQLKQIVCPARVQSRNRLCTCIHKCFFAIVHQYASNRIRLILLAAEHYHPTAHKLVCISAAFLSFGYAACFRCYCWLKITESWRNCLLIMPVECTSHAVFMTIAIIANDFTTCRQRFTWQSKHQIAKNRPAGRFLLLISVFSIHPLMVSTFYADSFSRSEQCARRYGRFRRFVQCSNHERRTVWCREPRAGWG